MKKETACFSYLFAYLCWIDVTENLGTLCQCQISLDKLGKGTERRKEGREGEVLKTKLIS